MSGCKELESIPVGVLSVKSFLFFFQSTLFGMAVAFAYCCGKYLKMFDDNNKRTLFSRPVGFTCLVFAVVALVVRLNLNRPYVVFSEN